jgi:formylglycine-generating enzyme required for sulfatase activity/tRNA A-37 threonylcarbamoyl transferase component Bud32
MTVTSVGDLLAVLPRLLEADQLDEMKRSLSGRFAESRALAGELIRRGWLTPYQVNQIFQGRGDELVLGSYVLLERLGEGGMGQVFKARHHKLGRIVALKIIRKERLATPSAADRFHKEIRAAARLSHPNIVHAYDAEEVDGALCLVTEYVEGIDLARLVKQQGPLPVEKACDYVQQAALGLQHVHIIGLVHRDLKPHNLLVTPKGDVKILDLGLARLSVPDSNDSGSGLTSEGVVVGTADYIAPEQAVNSHAADIRSDLYSLGCTFYFLLTGQVPFPGDDTLTKLMRHQSEVPPDVEQVRPDVPPDVAAVLRKLLAKSPEDRYQTPDEAAHALAALRGDPAFPTADAPRRRRTRRAAPARRGVLLMAGGGVLLVGLLTVAAVNWSGSDNPPTEPPASPPPSPSPTTAKAAPAERQLTNSLDMKLVLIPAGEFIMGSSAGEPGRGQNEGPPKRVTIRQPFYLGIHLVTVGNFQAFADATGYKTEAEKGGGAHSSRSNGEFDPACTWRSPGWEQDKDHPVACLSWNDANAFCQWLSKKEGKTYRLPKEIEWEYACRAGSSRAYGYGGDPARLGDYAWFADNSDGHAHPVGRKKANNWGLFDMHGNLFEWCEDFYDPHFYGHSERAGVQEPRPGETRVLRGGSWHSADAGCRCAWRGWDTPGNRRNDRGGFRVVLVSAGAAR